MSVVRLVNRVVKRVTSAAVSGRRNALRPNVSMTVLAHAAPMSAVAGVQVMYLAFAVALAMTAADTASAAILKPSHAR